MIIEALNRCLHDSSALVCPSNELTLATNISWIGFPLNPETHVIFIVELQLPHARAIEIGEHVCLEIGKENHVFHFSWPSLLAAWVVGVYAPNVILFLHRSSYGKHLQMKGRFLPSESDKLYAQKPSLNGDVDLTWQRCSHDTA